MVVVASGGAEPGEVLGQMRRIGAEALVVGGSAEVRAGRAGRPRFFANQQGGFRVRCPQTGAELASVFASALEEWRRGGGETLRCPCGAEHRLAHLTFAPPAAFGDRWIEAFDAASLDLVPGAAAVIGSAWPEAVVVGRRG